MAQQERAVATRESIIRAGAVVFGRQHFDSVRIVDLLQIGSNGSLSTQEAAALDLEIAESNLDEQQIRSAVKN